MGTELAQVVTKLAEGVVVLAEAVLSQDAFVQLPRRPVSKQAAGVQKAVEQPDEAVVMQLDAGDAARPGPHRGGQCRQRAPIHRGIADRLVWWRCPRYAARLASSRHLSS